LKIHAVASDILLPPQPIITRYGTWVHGCRIVLYAEHFDKVKAVLDQLNEEDAASKAAAIVQFCTPGIREQLTYLKTCLGPLRALLSAILQLELRRH